MGPQQSREPARRPDLPRHPSSSAIGRSASITTMMCSSRSTPSSSAPSITSSRLTPDAKLFCFSFLRTDLGSSVERPSGPHERARMHEAGELVACEQDVLEVGLSRRDVLQVVGVRQDRADEPLRVAGVPQVRGTVLGMLVEGRVPLVVEVVQQGHAAPRVLVGAAPAGVCANRGLDRVGVTAQRLALGPLVQQRERCGAIARQRLGIPGICFHAVGR